MSFKENYQKAFKKVKKWPRWKQYIIPVILISLLLSPLGVYAYNTIMDCRKSFTITNDTVSNVAKNAEKAYELCKWNHQAQAYRIAYVLPTYEEKYKAFLELDMNKFKTNDIGDSNAAERMFFVLIYLEQNPERKVQLLKQSIPYEMNPCQARIDIVNEYIKQEKWNEAQDSLNFFETDYQKVNEYRNCKDVMFAYKYGRITTQDTYFDYIFYSIKIYANTNQTDKLKEYKDLLKEIQPKLEFPNITKAKEILEKY